MATQGQDTGGAVYIRPVVSADGVADGVADIKQEFQKIPEAAKQATTETNKQLSGLGKDGAKGIEEFNLATQRAYKQLERLNLEIESGGRNTPAYIIGRAKAAGAETAALDGLVEKYKQLNATREAAANAGAAGLGAANTATKGLVEGTKAYNAALRQVPAQITDIVVGLQGGQAPLTVLLQQGGQLKDVFQGVAPAARAIGGYIAGLINPFTVTAAAAAAFGYAIYQASQDAKALNEALVLTGNKSGATIGNLSKIASTLADTGIGAGTATAALVDFINAGVKADDRLQSFTKTAIELERLGGPAVEKTAKAFADLAKDPLNGLDRLTLATYKQIEALLEQGNKIEAVKVAQDALQASNENMVVSLKAQQGPIDTAIDYWKRFGAEIWNAAKGLAAAAGFRDKTGNEQRKELQQRRDQYARDGYDTTEIDKQLAYFAAIEAAQNKTNAGLETQRKLKESLADLDKNNPELKRIRERADLVTRLNDLLAANQISQKRYNDELAAFDEKNSKKPKKEELTDAQRSLASYVEELQKRIDKEEELTEVQKAQNKLASLGTTGQIPQVRELVLGRAQLADSLKNEEKFTKSAVKAYEDYQKEQDKVLDGYKKSADAAEKSLQKYQDEEKAVKIAAEKNISLAQAIAEVELARLQELRAQKLKEGTDGETLLALQREIEARKKIVEAINTKDAREASKKATEEAAKEWKRTADEIERTITDALMRGFENGKGFIENLRDTIVNTFKTMVLRPTVQAIVSGTGNAAMQYASQAATRFAGSSAANLLGITGSSGSLAAGTFELQLSESAMKMLAGAAKAIPYVAAAVAIASLIEGNGFIGQLFGNGDYVKSGGEATTGFSATGAITSQMAVRNSGGAAGDASAQAFTKGLNSSYLQAAALLGIKASETAFSFGSNNSDGGKFRIGASVAGAGQVFDSQEISAKDGATQLAASRAVFAALQASDLPKYLKGAFDGLVASNLSQDQITAALQGAQVFKSLHDTLLNLPFENIKDLSYTAYKGLIEFSGGLEKLGANLATYYENFYSADEQRTQTTKNIAASLNAAGGNFTAEAIAELTRPAFRALVEQTDPTSPLYAALLGVAGAFASITPVAKEAAGSVDNSAQEIARTNASLQDKLDLLTGRQTDRSIELRNATDDTTRALLRQIYAQEDLNAAASKFASSMSGLGDTTFDLQNQVLTLQGKSDEVRQRVRTAELAKLTDGLTDPEQIAKIAATYDFNEGLRDQIKALQDAAKAQQEAAQAQQAAQAAAENAARAAEQLRQSWQSVTDSIFGEVKRIRDLMGGNNSQGFASAQANFAITAAQASAGDQNAAKLLPQLSQVLLQLAESNATSLAQLRLIQAQTAGTLEAIGTQYAGQYGLTIPKLDTGTNMVPQDMIALIHKGEAVVPAAYNPANGGAGNEQVVAELQALRAEVMAMRAANDSTATATAETQGLLKRVIRNDSLVTKDYSVA